MILLLQSRMKTNMEEVISDGYELISDAVRNGAHVNCTINSNHVVETGAPRTDDLRKLIFSTASLLEGVCQRSAFKKSNSMQ